MRKRGRSIKSVKPNGFRASALHGETISNIRAGGFRNLALGMTSLVTGFALLWLSGTDTARVRDAWQAQVDAGLYSWRVTTSDETGLSVTDCDALNNVEGVTGAGAIMRTTYVSPASLPSASFPVLMVSPGYLNVAWPGDRVSDASIVSGPEIASELGLKADTVLAVAAEEQSTVKTALHIDSVPEVRSKIDGINRAVLISGAAQGRAAECVVESRPGAHELVAQVLRGWSFDSKDSYAADMLITESQPASPERTLDGRSSRYFWLLCGGFLSLLLVTSWEARRAEFAIYRLMGVRGTGVWRMLVTEAAIMVAIPAQLGATIALCLLVATQRDAIAALLLLDNLRLLAILYTGTALSALLLIARSPLEIFKRT